MTTIEIGLLITLSGGILGILTFMFGRQTAAKNDGERWGYLKSDIEHMKNDIAYIKTAIEKNASDTKDSIRRIHERLDEHLRNEHGINTPITQNNI